MRLRRDRKAHVVSSPTPEPRLLTDEELKEARRNDPELQARLKLAREAMTRSPLEGYETVSEADLPAFLRERR